MTAIGQKLTIGMAGQIQKVVIRNDQLSHPEAAERRLALERYIHIGHGNRPTLTCLE